MINRRNDVIFKLKYLCKVWSCQGAQSSYYQEQDYFWKQLFYFELHKVLTSLQHGKWLCTVLTGFSSLYLRHNCCQVLNTKVFMEWGPDHRYGICWQVRGPNHRYEVLGDSYGALVIGTGSSLISGPVPGPPGCHVLPTRFCFNTWLVQLVLPT